MKEDNSMEILNESIIQNCRHHFRYSYFMIVFFLSYNFHRKNQNVQTKIKTKRLVHL